MWKITFIFVLSCCVFVQEARGDKDDVKIGDECTLIEDCEDIDDAICNTDDVCDCKDGYVASSDNSTCLELATNVGDECEVQEQCSRIPSAKCLGKICVVAQAVTNPPTTTKPKEECTEDSQCSSFLIKRVCKNGSCVIAAPTVTAAVSGLDQIVIGKPCTSAKDCSGESLTCTDSLCRCQDGFVPSQNLTKCLPKAKSAGDSCSESTQCMALSGSICENGKCTQEVMKVLRDFGEKISKLLIGSTCQHDNECKHMTHARCLEYVCQCEDNYVTSIKSDSCLEKAKKEGDPCSIDKQCEDIKGATCLQQKCVKPGVVGTKLGKGNSGSTITAPKLALAVIMFVKVFSV